MWDCPGTFLLSFLLLGLTLSITESLWYNLLLCSNKKIKIILTNWLQKMRKSSNKNVGSFVPTVLRCNSSLQWQETSSRIMLHKLWLKNIVECLFSKRKLQKKQKTKMAGQMDVLIEAGSLYIRWTTLRIKQRKTFDPNMTQMCSEQ